jgi:hypothetical protein
MRTITTPFAAFALALALGGTAAAQDRGAATAPDTEFTFEDDEVLGGTVGPEESRVQLRGRGPRHSLVRPRLHFVPEMLKSVETL